jgi:regulator of sigma E protease
MDFLIAVISFILVIGILVTIHEFGHFWVAKKLNIKVLRFSIGFGKILKSWKIGETTYTICALPLGGFVKMLDEAEGKVNEEEKHRAFNRQNVYKRIAVVIAGPLFNFILAVILYTIIFSVGVYGIKPIVGSVETNSIANKSGLETGDQILSVNNQKTPTISEFSIKFIQELDKNQLQLKTISKNLELKNITLIPSEDFFKALEQGIDEYLGFKFALPKIEAIIDEVFPDSPAMLAGLKSKDTILKANNQNINSWHEFVKIIQSNANKEILLTVMRDNSILDLVLIPRNQNNSIKAGVSVMVPDNYLDDWKVLIKKDLIDSFFMANSRVYQLAVLNLKIIKEMILGKIPLNQISGPISIANYAGQTAQTGIISFLSFLALVSTGLGLLNLLPIPMLDGGHLFLYLIEIVKGSKVNQKLQQTLTKIGFSIIVLLTALAMYNDILRLLSF